MASFREMDSNNDEKISKSELEEFLKSVGVDDLPDGFWEESDLDHDGFLSWTEFMSAQQQQQQQQQSQPTNKLSQREREEAAFHSMDTDKDGKISKSELGDFFKQAGGEMTDEFWDESDLDNDGFLSWEEFVSDANSKEHQKQEQKDELDFEYNVNVLGILDTKTDKDGKISKSELSELFKQQGGELTDEFWDESDLDNDGFISWEEFVADSNSEEQQKQEQKDEL
eukprot:CAMPEP_0195255220 /NCGR_PEP_ID=MMETSP0706-20130129/5516_1 /TAXON_ID=33640 /ORGANISM="Asterionellopsis glacialis, Strain CCMP134" /LENGTH=225 /DNA_ID=CAMNT_0040308041 /DNA_START=104 /DNA_END=781 /DNA_ORIENTATION=-